MELVVAGHLHISQGTVENHRAAIMKKTGSKSVPVLARLAIAAAWNGPEAPADSAQGKSLLYALMICGLLRTLAHFSSSRGAAG
jgi:hypothetical protein